MKRIWAALALAAAAVTSLSLAVPAVVSAAPTQPKAVYRQWVQGFAGYRMTGWRFRYVATTVTVPACTTGATSVRIELAGDEDAADITVKCNGGAGSIRYNISWLDSSRPFALSPRVGDPITISIYHDPSTNQNRYTATNRRSGRTSSAALNGGVVMHQALVSGGGPATPATRQARLWKFRDTRVTNNYGTRGGILSPPTTYRMFGITAEGTEVLLPTWPSDTGHNNFDVLWGTGS